MRPPYPQLPAETGQRVDLDQHGDPASDSGRDGGALQAKRGDRSEAEDQQGVEHDVEAVGDPEHPHRDRRIARAPESGVLQEQEYDHDISAEHDPDVRQPGRHHALVGTHQAQDVRGVDHAGHPEDDRKEHSQKDRLCGRARGTVPVALAGTPRHHGRHADAQPHRHRVDDRDGRLGQRDARHRLVPQPRDEEDVHDREERLHRHFQHHGDGEEDDRASQRPAGGIAACAADRVHEDLPPRLGRRL